MNGITCKVLVCCHKQDVHANQEPYLPIQVGKSVSNLDLKMQGDNTGENISKKNSSYCELTGLYWAWKNLSNVDVIGLCHYRRYFDFHKQCSSLLPYTKFPTSSFSQININIPDRVIERVYKGSIVVARARNYRYNLMVNYCLCHISEDFYTLESIIESTQTKEIRTAFKEIFYKNNKLRPYNMFLMNYTLFEEYCSWLFPIIEQLEKKTNISNYSLSQKRIYGYVAERLFNVWIATRHEKIEEYPVIWFSDNSDVLEKYSPISYYIHSTINDFSNRLFNYKNLDFDK